VEGEEQVLLVAQRPMAIMEIVARWMDRYHIKKSTAHNWAKELLGDPTDRIGRSDVWSVRRVERVEESEAFKAKLRRQSKDVE
jgi:hypothetical protein